MIGRIEGKVIEHGVTEVLVDVHGVGYEIEIPLSTYASIANSETVVLHTHLVVREDAQQLFGFATRTEREFFRALIKVNRVGPKLAIAILSGMDVAGIGRCIRDKDVKALSGLRGVGKKMAEQIVLDLAGNLPELVGIAPSSQTQAPAGTSLADAESALIGMGFKPQEAARALAGVEDPEAGVETLIRQALRALG